MKRSTKVHAHDELNSAKIGDLVTVQECRPLSKSKTWMLLSDIPNKNDVSTDASASIDSVEGDQL
jgi:small subunit ribosomal protein S17